MSNPKTKLNGYRFGGQPYTDTPFWEEPGGGGDEYYTADECDARFAKATTVYTKTQTYTKEEVDALIEGIEPSVDAYTKAETDALLDAKADKSTTYTKTQVDDLIAQIPSVDAYTKAQTDALLDDKADKSTTYTKTQVDTLIPDVSGYAKSTTVYLKSQTYSKTEVDDLLSNIPTIDAYTKSQTDALLATKANTADVYTKSQTDNLLNGKADSFNVYDKRATDRLLATKANTADVYTKTQTDDLLHDKADVTDVYTKTQVYTKSETDALIPDVSGYAKSTTVYLKSETYTKSEVDALISGAGGGAQIDDSTTSSSKVWSSNKTWDTIKAAQNTAAIYRGLAKYDNNHGLHGTFDESHTYSTGSITITLTKYDGTSASYDIVPTRLPWRYMASPQYSYPGEDAQWKSYILGDIEVFMTLSGNVAASAGIKNPYLYINAPKGSGVMSISVTYANGDWEVYGATESNLTQAVSDCQDDIYDLQLADQWEDISGDLTPATGVSVTIAKQRGDEVYIELIKEGAISSSGETLVTGVPECGAIGSRRAVNVCAFSTNNGLPILTNAALVVNNNNTIREFTSDTTVSATRRYCLYYHTT